VDEPLQLSAMLVFTGHFEFMPLMHLWILYLIGLPF